MISCSTATFPLSLFAIIQLNITKYRLKKRLHRAFIGCVFYFEGSLISSLLQQRARLHCILPDFEFLLHFPSIRRSFLIDSRWGKFFTCSHWCVLSTRESEIVRWSLLLLVRSFFLLYIAFRVHVVRRSRISIQFLQRLSTTTLHISALFFDCRNRNGNVLTFY